MAVIASKFIPPKADDGPGGAQPLASQAVAAMAASASTSEDGAPAQVGEAFESPAASVLNVPGAVVGGAGAFLRSSFFGGGAAESSASAADAESSASAWGATARQHGLSGTGQPTRTVIEPSMVILKKPELAKEESDGLEVEPQLVGDAAEVARAARAAAPVLAEAQAPAAAASSSDQPTSPTPAASNPRAPKSKSKTPKHSWA